VRQITEPRAVYVQDQEPWRICTVALDTAGIQSKINSPLNPYTFFICPNKQGLSRNGAILFADLARKEAKERGNASRRL
jgi:hypothetical protein